MSVFIMVYGRYAPVGRLINKSLRLAGKVIPKKLATIFVTKTGLFRNSNLSLLDTMYVPIEIHLSKKEIEEYLNCIKLIDIKFYPSYKWTNSFFSNPWFFGTNIQNNFSAIKK